jgi:uncharacterized membrane protein
MKLKKPTKIIVLVAVVLWTIGAVSLYKKGSGNVAIILTAIIIFVGSVTQIVKRVNNE